MRLVLAVIALLTLAPAVHASSVQDLVRAYPDFLAGVEGGFLVWRDGTRMAINDGQPNKTPEEALRHGSIADQMRLPYPAGAPVNQVPDSDPGRVRNKAFFEKMYGDCHTGDVAAKLVRVVWLPESVGQSISITSVNGVDRALAAVSRDLDALPAEYQKFLWPLGGTYACRTVAGTGQTSVHAWGAAIDINPKFSDYWHWRHGAGYQNRIPAEIVAAFERHGFIWGGRWAHYDTMHFEYRPELTGHAPEMPD
ncbi:MAG: M15 family metallopeptidase [Rhodopila sp.]